VAQLKHMKKLGVNELVFEIRSAARAPHLGWSTLGRARPVSAANSLRQTFTGSSTNSSASSLRRLHAPQATQCGRDAEAVGSSLDRRRDFKGWSSGRGSTSASLSPEDDPTGRHHPWVN